MYIETICKDILPISSCIRHDIGNKAAKMKKQKESAQYYQSFMSSANGKYFACFQIPLIIGLAFEMVVLHQDIPS